jgi:hypothetical protein
VWFSGCRQFFVGKGWELGPILTDIRSTLSEDISRTNEMMFLCGCCHFLEIVDAIRCFSLIVSFVLFSMFLKFGGCFCGGSRYYYYYYSY